MVSVLTYQGRILGLRLSNKRHNHFVTLFSSKDHEIHYCFSFIFIRFSRINYCVVSDNIAQFDPQCDGFHPKIPTLLSSSGM